jgi:uncharacterized delta-60 repeat protein
MKRGVAVVALVVALCASLGSAALAAPEDLEPGFGQNGRLTLDSDIARALALQPDGRILVAGEVATNTPSHSDGVVHRLNASGSLDRTFGSGGAVRLGGIFSGGYALALQPDAKVLTVGFASDANAPSGEDALVFRLDPGGLSDQTFGQGGSVALDSGGNERPYALALQPGDGKILVAGETYDRNTATSKPVVYRLTAGGKLDDGFGQSGTSRPDAGGSGAIYKLALQPDGRILAAGYTEANDNRNAVVYRLNADGTPDSGFGQGGKAEFDEGGSEAALAVAPQPDGHIALAANAGDAMGTTADAIVYRLRADGTADPTFGAGGKTRIADSDTNVAYALALQPDGKIVLAGGAAVNGATDATVYRLNPDGSPDAGFDGDGTLHIESDGGEAADALAIAPDGRIVIAGVAISGLSQRAVLYRLQGGDPVSLPPASTASPTASTSRPGAPALGRLRITPEAFRAAPKGARARAAARRDGALVSFTLDRAASVRFTVERAGRGRRVGGRCAKPSRSNHRGRRCTRYTTLAGGFTRHGVAGANRFHFTGRLNARRLRSGSYRLIATPSADGRRGEAQRARFHIKG